MCGKDAFLSCEDAFLCSHYLSVWNTCFTWLCSLKHSNFVYIHMECTLFLPIVTQAQSCLHLFTLKICFCSPYLMYLLWICDLCIASIFMFHQKHLLVHKTCTFFLTHVPISTEICFTSICMECTCMFFFTHVPHSNKNKIWSTSIHTNACFSLPMFHVPTKTEIWSTSICVECMFFICIICWQKFSRIWTVSKETVYFFFPDKCRSSLVLSFVLLTNCSTEIESKQWHKYKHLLR